MKFSFAILVTSLVLLSSCGSSEDGACSDSAVIGSWYNSDNEETLKFKADCTGSSNTCGSTFSYPNVVASSGSVLVNVNSTSGLSGCLPLGETSCIYAIDGQTLGFNCGDGDLYYTKK